MKLLGQNLRTGALTLEEVPPPHAGPGQVLVRNVISVISTGTERASIASARQSLLGKARARPDLVNQVVDKVRRDGPVQAARAVQGRLSSAAPLGYSSAGVVVEVGEGATDFIPGDRVACAGAGYANHAELIAVPHNLVTKLPDEVDFESGAFTTLGAIALQGIRIAAVGLGENVAVIGLGLIGQLTSQLLEANGCRVLGIDINAGRVDLAESIGCCRATATSDEQALDAGRSLTAGRGVDAVLITAATKSSSTVKLAGELCREKGRVVAVGLVGMDIPRRTYYSKELTFHVSRSYGPGRYDRQYEEGGIDYPYGYVRWTEKRNMEAFVDVMARGHLAVEKLITHRFPFEDALQAYDTMEEPGGQHLAVLLEYAGNDSRVTSPRLALEGRRRTKVAADTLSVGVVGAGNFARTVLLPQLSRLKGVQLRGLATATGLNAKNTADRYGFGYCTTDEAEVLDDDDTEAVVIATRHGLHASQVERALRADKAVFVEKPLSVTRQQLEIVAEALAASNGRLMVGYNRRFAPIVQRLEEHIDGRREPLSMHYQVNAGPLPADSWILNPEEGGGRIVGEVCHFVDLMMHLSGTPPRSVYAQSLGADAPETISATLQFRDGSVASISYCTNGDTAFTKERLEVYCGQSLAVIEDFRWLTTVKNGRTRRKKSSQDKGHQRELEVFVNAVRDGAPMPIEPAAIFAVSETTFCIQDSMKTGLPAEVPPQVAG